MRQIFSFRIHDSGSNAGGTHNDDWWGSVATAVWMLDGATALSRERLFPTAPSDAQWLVNAVDSELRSADWSKATAPLLQSAIKRVRSRFHLEAVRHIDQPALWPVASFALVRLCGDYIEFVNVGDCRTLWKHAETGAVESFGSSRVSELDGNVVSEIRRLHRQGITSNESVWQAITPMIEANRKLKNTSAGYWILDVDGEGISHAQTMVIKAEEVEIILLCTDGYYRFVDTYQKRTNHSLLSDSFNVGISALIEELRIIERRDERCLKFPRIKPSDDATAVLVLANREDSRSHAEGEEWLPSAEGLQTIPEAGSRA